MRVSICSALVPLFLCEHSLRGWGFKQHLQTDHAVKGTNTTCGKTGSSEAYCWVLYVYMRPLLFREITFTKTGQKAPRWSFNFFSTSLHLKDFAQDEGIPTTTVKACLILLFNFEVKVPSPQLECECRNWKRAKHSDPHSRLEH